MPNHIMFSPCNPCCEDSDNFPRILKLIVGACYTKQSGITVIIEKNGILIATGVTDDNGEVEFVLRPGKYTLTYSLENYHTIITSYTISRASPEIIEVSNIYLMPVAGRTCCGGENIPILPAKILTMTAYNLAEGAVARFIETDLFQSNPCRWGHSSLGLGPTNISLLYLGFGIFELSFFLGTVHLAGAFANGDINAINLSFYFNNPNVFPYYTVTE